MKITLEQIDQLRKRTNCSYEEAKVLLEKHDGDVLEAIVDFERGSRFKGNHKKQEKRMKNEVKSIFEAGFKTRLVVTNEKKNIANLSINFMILMLFVAFPGVLVGLGLAILMGYNITIVKSEGEEYNFNKVFNNVTDKFKDTHKKDEENTVETDEKPAKESSEFNEYTVE